VFGQYGRGVLIKMAYPNLTSLNVNSSVADLLALPNSSFPYFWTLILFGLGAIVALSAYFKEKASTGRGNLLSSMAVASLAIIVLATLGSLMKIVTYTALIPLVVICMVLIAIWFFSG